MRTFFAFILVMIIVLASTPARRAQEKFPIDRQGPEECGTRIPDAQREVEMERLAQAAIAAPEALNPPTDAPYYLPLSIHIVRASNGTGGLSDNDLNASIANLNRFWQPVGIQFFIYGGIDYINNDTHFNVPNNQTNRDNLRQVNPVANTINVHFTNLASLNGQSSFTTDAFQGILMDITASSLASAPASANASTFAHEMGHYFDLYHTHENWPNSMGTPTRVECPNGSNCSTTGDLVCDTAADPGLSSRVGANCAYNNSASLPSSCDNTAYNPPVRNLMSYSTGDCRTEFTAGQIQRALRILRDTANRRSLIIRASRYVDPLASRTNADCSYNYPCHTVAKAVGLALNGDFIFIKPGVNPATYLGGKRVTLNRWGTYGFVLLRP